MLHAPVLTMAFDPVLTLGGSALSCCVKQTQHTWLSGDNTWKLLCSIFNFLVLHKLILCY